MFVVVYEYMFLDDVDYLVEELYFPLDPIKGTCSSTSHSSSSSHIISAMHLGISTYTFASFRIARSNSGSSSRGAGRRARGARAGGARSRRGGR
jgi:hypothetical protein